METLKKHPIVIIICALVLVSIIAFAAATADPVDFNELYPDLDEEYWCEIADDGSWMKISINDFLNYIDRFEVEDINEDLGFSSAVYGKMMNTRAVDGRLTAKGKNVKASWSHDGKELSILYEADINALSIFVNKAVVIILVLAMVACIIGAGYFVFGRNKATNNDIQVEAPPAEHSEGTDGGISSDVPPASENANESPKPDEAAPQQISAADEILKFKQLLDMGVISQDEFDAKKKELLGL